MRALGCRRRRCGNSRYDTRPVVLQHIACEPPGIYEDVLLARGIEVVRAELDEGDPSPTCSKPISWWRWAAHSVNDDAGSPGSLTRSSR